MSEPPPAITALPGLLETTVHTQQGRLAAMARVFAATPGAVPGLLILVLFALFAALAPRFYPVNPFSIVHAPMAGPGQGGLLGADYLGRDVLAGMISGAGTTLIVGFSATLFSVILGVGIGAFAGFYGGRLDLVLTKLTEFFQVLPPLLLAMVLVTLFQPTLPTIVLSIGVVGWTAVGRVIRAECARIRRHEFVLAEQAMGASNLRTMLRVVLPNAIPSLVVVATLQAGTAILFAAGLSFLGLADPNTMTWGLMIGESRNFIWQDWWAVTFPGLAIVLTVLSINLAGDGLAAALNPRLRT
ncbi:MAG: ABC transporter permease [Acetobacteraceae bacterium]